MLATYPVESTAENWLSDCLASRLLSRLEQLEAGGEIVEFPSDFDEELREVIESYPRVTKRFKSLSDAFAGLTPEQRVIVRNAIESQNQIPEVFDTAFPCTDCGEELPDIQKLAKELFEFSFGALSRIKSPNSDVPIRDRHYEIAYGHLQKKCCPFCGMERLEPYHPDVPRHDLDHYLAISRYPFSGTNLKNLTPMGDRCNSSYKLALDILYDPNGNRLPCYDPYGDVTASFSLEGSELFGGHGGGPVWEVCLTPETPETANWGRIFRLKLRLEESLKAEFRGWLVEIGGFLRGLACNLGIIEEVKAGQSRYKDACSLESLPSVALLKEGVASVLLQGLEAEDQKQRTHAFLIDAFA